MVPPYLALNRVNRNWSLNWKPHLNYFFFEQFLLSFYLPSSPDFLSGDI